MNVGSLFSGIGGLDLGLERAGFQVRWQVEKDPWCQKVLAKHWPDVKRYGDIKALDPALLEPVDLICGGFPCQPVSVAGKQKGQADERWLWPEFARIVRGLRPRYLLLENVPGLLTASQGRAAQEVFGDLAALGYDAEWECIPAAAVGAPHLRYRVFIVAYSSGTVIRNEPRWGGRPRGEDSSILGQHGQVQPVAYPPEFAQRESEYAAISQPWEVTWAISRRRSWWESEPDVGRVADGVPSRMDRLRGLGNAVVPQVAEVVGRAILER